MAFDIVGPFVADELFKLAPVKPAQGKPNFMNLAARRNSGRAAVMEQLKGAGLYGLFLFGKLFYVGIFSGAATDSRAGSVLSRWKLHLTYQTLRSPNVCFSRSNIEQILADQSNPVFEDIAKNLEGCTFDLAASARDLFPLLETHGGSCTYRKARFAAINWEVLRPGNEVEMGKAISFVFARLQPDLLANAAPMDRSHRQWIKYEWLERCEGELIRALRPICNNETQPGTEEQATIAEFVQTLAVTAAGTFAPYIPPTQSCNVKDLGPGDADKELLASSSIENMSDAAIDDRELEDMQPGEANFRARLSVSSEAFVDELGEICPPGIEMGFVNIPELRLFCTLGHRVLIKVQPRAKGGMVAFVRTSPVIAQALGFSDATKAGDWTRCALDPADHQPSALIALAGAVLADMV